MDQLLVRALTISCIIFIMKYIGQGIDYTSGPYSVQFDAGENRTSFNVSINNDNILESSEVLNLTVNASSLPSSVTVGDHGHATVTIVDNDGKCEAINALIRNCCHFFKPKAL